MQIGQYTVKPGQLYFGMAVIMALACGLVLNGGGKKDDSAPAKTEAVKEPTTPVVVASYPVHAGEVLQSDQLQIVDWPVKHLPVGQTFQDLTTLVGKAVKADVFQGEPVFKEKLASVNGNGGLPVLIPQGLRAVTIAVSEVKGVAGFIKPGDKVDVLATFAVKQSDNKEDQITKTVLQNVLVIASAQDMKKSALPTPEDYPELEAKKRVLLAKAEKPKTPEEEEAAKKEAEEQKKKDEEDADKKAEDKKKEESAKLVSSVTLAVTPAQAERLTLAEDTGTLRLILRPDNDPEMVSVSGVKQSQLIGSGSTAISSRAVPTARLRYQVEVIQGTEKGKVNF
jgi:Flp pilus assembly protein CpaB